MSELAPCAHLFGTNITAMVTPMGDDGSVTAYGVKSLVSQLLSAGSDGVVVAGTTGEAPTLSASETIALVRQITGHASGRARVIVGVGTYDTAESIRRAEAAASAGADALLLVAPYYSRPSQAGIVAHCTAVADATDLPVMLYDVPARTGVAFTEASLVELAGHRQIRAVKDAKGDLFQATSVIASTTMEYYCGIDELNLAYLASGATGLVSVVANVAADRTGELIRAVQAGDLATARSVDRDLHPLTRALLQTGSGAVMTKAALADLGRIPSATVRLPLAAASSSELADLRAALTLATIQ